jgi:alcohol dehydrogenase
MARAAGAAEVICCDPATGRLAQAAAFGAGRLAAPPDLPVAVGAATSGYGVDVALELSGSPAAVEAGLPLVRIGGTYVLVGAVFPTRSVTIEPEQVVRRLLTLRGVHNYAPEDLVAAIRFLAAAGRYPFDSLVSAWVPLADAARGFDLARSPDKFRVGVQG